MEPYVEPTAYSMTMASASRGRSRNRGEVEQLPSGALRVRVYAGIDPVSKKKHYLVETVPAGPSAARDAERVRTRLLNQVDERRNPRTKAWVRGHGEHAPTPTRADPAVGERRPPGSDPRRHSR